MLDTSFFFTRLYIIAVRLMATKKKITKYVSVWPQPYVFVRRAMPL